MRTGEYDLVQFFVIEMAVVLGVAGAGQAFSFAPDISQAKAATADVTRLLDHKPDIDIWSNEGCYPATLKTGQIEFRRVYFRYPSRSSLLSISNTRPEKLILRDLSLKISPGQYIALVGRSGCGKSTVAALLERFYDPTSGDVLVDGTPVLAYNLREFRKNLAIVSQEPSYLPFI